MRVTVGDLLFLSRQYDEYYFSIIHLIGWVLANKGRAGVK